MERAAAILQQESGRLPAGSTSGYTIALPLTDGRRRH